MCRGCCLHSLGGTMARNMSEPMLVVPKIPLILLQYKNRWVLGQNWWGQGGCWGCA